MKTFRGRINGAVLIAILLFLAPTACRFPGTKGTYEPRPEDCHIDMDQQGAFMARVTEFPIPVRIDSAFTSEELPKVLSAIASWNDYGRQLILEDFIQVVSERESLPDP